MHAALQSTVHASYQPRSLRSMASEQVLNNNHFNKSLFKVKNVNSAMKKNSIVMEITSKIPMDEDTFVTKAKSTVYMIY
jgi:hypothetical protein